MYVFGNGESRTSIDIDKLNGPKIGCNAIHRDYHMDHLVCVDRRMAQEAVDANLKHTQIYTRKDWISWFPQGVTTVPNLPYEGEQRWDEPFQWGSGPYAVLLSVTLYNDRTAHLIGFDLHSTTTTVNNVYKGTSNYDKADKRPVDPRYWIHQIGMVFDCFPNTQFKILVKDDWTLPKAWTQPNVKVDNISTLLYNKI